jgi:DivIVA domain-containing protein
MTDDAFHLTALDARRYDFGNALRGYDRARVDQFRDQVAEELERLSRSNQELEVKARNFHEQLRAFRERDKALNDALISAQQLRGEIREQAQREAQLIIREAQGEAERSLEALRGEIRRAEEELQQLWRNRRSYLAQLRNLMERQLSDVGLADMAPPPAGVVTRASDPLPPVRREPPRDAEPEPARDIPRELVREFTNDATREAFRDPIREPNRDATRESGRESGREPQREPAPETTANQLREQLNERLREGPPPRPALPTPSWLDVVEGE